MKYKKINLVIVLIFLFSLFLLSCNENEKTITKEYNFCSKALLESKGSINLYDLKFNKGIGSTGGNILVIPIEFKNYPFTEEMLSNTYKAFFGKDEDTGWESLRSYYLKSSNNICNITGDIVEVYKTNRTYNFYDNIEKESKLGLETLMYEIINYYDEIIDYSKYDLNNDGYIDAIYLIYSCPIKPTINSMFWAYTSIYDIEDEYYDNVKINYYSLIGYDFFNEKLSNGGKIKINTKTIIHETGHMLGLSDYYNDEEKSGLAGNDMMDLNIGDHNAFSKSLLGWINPKVLDLSLLDDEVCIDLKSYSDTNEALIISPKWNNTLFDEYYIIDFYTPTSLYEKENTSTEIGLKKGIRIYHIDANINDSETKSIWNVYKTNNNCLNHKLIRLLNNDIFQKGYEITVSNWYNLSNISFSIKIIDINNEYSRIIINTNKTSLNY